jgi:hypothetical protein
MRTTITLDISATLARAMAVASRTEARSTSTAPVARGDTLDNMKRTTDLFVAGSGPLRALGSYRDDEPEAPKGGDA